MTTRTASIRLGKQDFENIDATCEKLGCTRNDFVKDAIKQKLSDTGKDTIEKIQTNDDGRIKPKAYRVLLDANRNYKQTNVPQFELDIPTDCNLLHINGKYFRNCKTDNEVWDETRKDIPKAEIVKIIR